MSDKARVCAHCRGLNATSETRCYRCGARLSGPWSRAWRDLPALAFGHDYPLTKLFVTACVVIYLFALLSGGWQPSRGILDLGAIRISEALRWGAIPSGLQGEPWRWLSAVFVHFSLLHVLFNCLALVDFGRMLEREIGSARFCILFVTTGVVGFWVSDLYHQASVTTAGASGALFGMMGCQVGNLLGARDPRWGQVGTRAVVYGVIFGLAFPVNNAAHAGGFVSGVGLGYAYFKEPRAWLLGRAYPLLAGMLLLASVASIVLAHQSSAWQYWRQLERAQDLARYGEPASEDSGSSVGELDATPCTGNSSKPAKMADPRQVAS